MAMDYPAAAKGNILLVDDAPNNLRLLAQMLEEHGYNVYTVTSGASALRSVALEAPDLILLDIAMPNMDGYEVCAHLQANPQTQEIPVIFISALDDTLDKVRAFEVGGVDYINKPFNVQEVLARVRTHLVLRGTQQQLALRNEQLQQEITERARARERLERVERALRALSECNESMLRATSESELLAAICASIVEKGDYRMAWVGFLVQQPVPHILPMAHAGYEEGYLQAIDLKLDDTLNGPACVATALQTGKPCVLNDMASSATHEPWRAEARQRGYAAGIALPLSGTGGILGVLLVYAAEPDAFDAEEVSLLLRLAENLTYGIRTLRSRAAHEQMETAMHEHHAQLQSLSYRLVEVQEQERRALARELHDEVGQILSGLNLSLELAARATNEQRAERLEQAQNLVNELIRHVRETSMRLRPPMLDDLGLLPALFWHFERYTEQTNINVICKHTGVEQRFPADIEITIYRMIQEALSNVAHHAGVSQVVVQIHADPDRLVLQVEDQGHGFKPEAAFSNPASSGLSGIRERTRLLNGQMSIDTAPGQGSCLTIKLPLPPPASHSQIGAA